MHKLLYYTILQFQSESLDMLRRNFELIELPDPDSDTAAILDEIDVTFAPLGFHCGKNKIDSCPNLKVIASSTTGVPHIDLEYAESKGVTVIALNTEQEFLKSITPTAEHTWGLLLSLTRRIPWAFESVKSGTWNRRHFPGKAMLTSLSLGIIGLGRLGSMVAKYGKCFGMNVQYYDPYIEHPEVEGIKRVGSLKELVSGNDIISLHIPHNKRNERLINNEIFNNFKKRSFFINTARAEAIDSSALLEALNSGRIAGAALDVFEGEFQKGFSNSQEFKNHPLLKYAQSHDNLLITPHIGGSTLDAWAKTEQYVINKLITFFEQQS